MSTIQFKDVNCKSCYKCIRNCPVKAISFKDDHAQIIGEGCVLCGRCLQICPQNAKSVKNDVDKVKYFIDEKYEIYASIAPSFVPAFNIRQEESINSLFRKLGFTDVRETAIGASVVTSEYKKLLLDKQMTNIITSACPTVISLIEKYHPLLINQLAPVVSPMISHAKMMKALYGSNIKVVFIGPCLAKKEEYKDSYNDDFIDAVITFEEFEKWINEEGLSFEDKLDIHTKAKPNLISRHYPAPGGIIKSLGILDEYDYKFIKFDGIDRCIDILKQIEKGNIKDYFIEMNSCTGGCLSGNCMNSGCGNFLEMKEKLVEYIDKLPVLESEVVENESKISMTKIFKDKSKKYEMPDEIALKEVLNKIGKFTKDKELDCGACGYATCREKAIAVINDKADLKMCLPYLRERAESISNVIIHSTPNAIFALTENFIVQEANLAACKIFNLENESLQGKNIFDILDCLDIYLVNETENDILNKKYNYKEHGLIVEQSILYIKESRMIIVIMKDITDDEKKNQQLHKVRCETAAITQKVIDKQMRVVQEIASLLGETTAETKVALTKLKKSILSEISDSI